eukprot:Em0018g57a
MCEEVHFKDVLERRNKDLDLIKLSVGCPCVYGLFSPHPVVTEAVKKVLDEGKYNGYGPSNGLLVTRTALAEYFSTEDTPLTAEDVVMATSAAGALELSITVFTNPGQNILVPKPGFAIFRCLAFARGVECKMYPLLPERSWEVDLEAMEKLIDHNTAAIVVNNPSNPCGSNYSRKHLEEILAVAERHHIPIIADEIYHGMVYEGQVYHPLGPLSKSVPILTCGGMSKRFVVPGWRVGWILIHDKKNAFKAEITPGIKRLAMKLLGPNTLVQAALPDILRNTPPSFFQNTLRTLESSAKQCYTELLDAPGLHPVMPAASMYMMVTIDIEHFPEFKDEIDFTKQLVLEQSVFCLPGMAFRYPNCFRIALVMPKEKIQEACTRMKNFCSKHYKA